MKLVDQLGNVLEVDDLLHFNLPTVSVVGKVIQITPGSTLLVRGRSSGKDEAHVTEGTCLLRIDIPLTFDPRVNQLQGALKIVDPNPPQDKGPEKKPQLVS